MHIKLSSLAVETQARSGFTVPNRTELSEMRH